MAGNKTVQTDASVDDHLAGIAGSRGDDARELDWFQIGFAARKQALTLYHTEDSRGTTSRSGASGRTRPASAVSTSNACPTWIPPF